MHKVTELLSMAAALFLGACFIAILIVWAYYDRWCWSLEQKNND